MAVLLLASSWAAAHGNGMLIGVAVGYCLAQDEGYAQLPGGRIWAQEESMVGFLRDLKPDHKACIMASKAPSAQFCTALLTVDPNSDSFDKEFDALAVEHKRAMEHLVASCEPDE